MLYIAEATARGEHTRMVSTFDDDDSASVQSVVDIHAAASVVDIGARAVGARANYRAVRGMNFMAASRRRMTGEGSRGSRTPSSASGTTRARMSSARTARMRATGTARGRTMRTVGGRTVRSIRGGSVRSSTTRGAPGTVRGLEAAARRAGMSSRRRVVGWRRRLLLLFVSGDARRRVRKSQGEQQPRRSQGTRQRVDL